MEAKDAIRLVDQFGFATHQVARYPGQEWAKLEEHHTARRLLLALLGRQPDEHEISEALGGEG